MEIRTENGALIEIRKSTKQDTNEQISSIYAQSWKKAYQGVVPQAYLDAIAQDQWVPAIERVRDSIWVADAKWQQLERKEAQQQTLQETPNGRTIPMNEPTDSISRELADAISRDRVGGLLTPAPAKRQRLIGVCVYGPAREQCCRGWGEVRAIYLLPGWGRMGIGSKLLQAAVNSLLKQGYHNLYLWTLKDNQIARCFYEKNGFHWEKQEKTEKIGGKALQLVQYCLRTDGRGAVI